MEKFVWRVTVIDILFSFLCVCVCVCLKKCNALCLTCFLYQNVSGWLVRISLFEAASQLNKPYAPTAKKFY